MIPSWLLLSALMQVGFIDGIECQYPPPKGFDFIWYQPAYLELEFDIQVKPFFASTNMICYAYPVGVLSLYPFQMTYTWNVGLRDDGIEVGWEHMCYHPIAPYQDYFFPDIKPDRDGAYDKFYLQLKIGK